MQDEQLEDEDFEEKPEEYKRHHNLAYEQRRTFVLNMVQGKSGNSTLIDYTYDEEVCETSEYRTLKNRLLCILTSFRVLLAPKSRLKYFFGLFSNRILVIFCDVLCENEKKCLEKVFLATP